jgi:hypothetical protein
LEFDRLEEQRVKTLDFNREVLKKQKFEMLKETQDMNQKIESDYTNYIEVDVREQYLIDERIENYKKMMAANKAEQLALVSVITKKAQEDEKKRLLDRSKKISTLKEEQDITVKAEEKKLEILKLQETLHKNA